MWFHLCLKKRIINPFVQSVHYGRIPTNLFGLRNGLRTKLALGTQETHLIRLASIQGMHYTTPYTVTVSFPNSLHYSSEWITELLHDHSGASLDDLWTRETHSIRDRMMLDLANYFQLPVNLIFVQDSPVVGTKKPAITQTNQDRLVEFVKDVVILFGFQFHVVNS